jgi:hypothetical protein
MRAEIRAGELLAEMKERGERRDHSQRSRGATSEKMPPKLSDIGVTKTQSSRWHMRSRLEIRTQYFRGWITDGGHLASFDRPFVPRKRIAATPLHCRRP